MLFLFISSNSFYSFFPHRKILPLVVMAWSGATTTEREAMNFQKYCVAKKKLITLVKFVGTGDFMIASIFFGSILSYPPPITYPKYTKYF
jgi:hypothetical protein